MYVFNWHIVLNRKTKIITSRAKFSHHNLQTPTSWYQIHMLDSRWIADNKDIKQCLWFLWFSHTIDILFVFEMPPKQYKQKLTLHEVISIYTRQIGAELYIFTSKRKLSDVKHGRCKSLKRIWSLYICFCFWILWRCQTDGPPNFYSLLASQKRHDGIFLWFLYKKGNLCQKRIFLLFF
jgi:hypothetical protein